MQIELDLPEIEGYEYTGEYRVAEAMEYFMEELQAVRYSDNRTASDYPILKKKAPKYEVITQGDFLQLCEGRRSGYVDLSARYVEIKAIMSAIYVIEDLATTKEDRQILADLKSVLNN